MSDRFAGHVTEHESGWQAIVRLSKQMGEARRWARRMKRERDEVRADNARLRELIKSVENVDNVCPFCDLTMKWHSPSCPAFNPDGTLK